VTVAFGADTMVSLLGAPLVYSCQRDTESVKSRGSEGWGSEGQNWTVRATNTTPFEHYKRFS
jgi:hypothetical protein